MGNSASPAQLVGKLNRFTDELKDQKAALNKVGMAGKKIFVGSAAGLIGRKPAGKRKIINARYDIGRDGHSVVIGYTGPAHLVMNPTKAHDILPKNPRGGRRRRRGAQALTIGGDLRASAHHPGTKGKPVFKRAEATAKKTLPPIYMKAQISEPLKQVFGH